jgi:hypothetical protein
MSTRRSVAQRTAVVTAGLATATVLALAGPSAASADPPRLNVDPCEQLLLRAAEWPGTSSDGYRLFSDAYDRYLSRQPACTTGT